MSDNIDQNSIDQQLSMQQYSNYEGVARSMVSGMILNKIFGILHPFDDRIKNMFIKLIRSLPNILFILVLGECITNKDFLKNIIKGFMWSISTMFFYKKLVLDKQNTVHINSYIANIISEEIIDGERIWGFPIYLKDVRNGCILHVMYMRGIHDRFIDNIIAKARLRMNKSIGNPDNTVYHRFEGKYVPYSTSGLYPSKNYVELESIVRSHFEISEDTNSSKVMSILIDGEKGLGKSSFSEYITKSNIAKDVFRVDMSSNICLETDPTTLFKQIFTNVYLRGNSIFMIDEMDRYVDIYISRSYDKMRHLLVKDGMSKKKKKEDNSNNYNADGDDNYKYITDRDSYAKNIKNEFLANLWDMLEATGLAYPCVIIFCSNNFDTIFKGIDNTHFESIKDRFIRINFSLCNKNEIMGYIRYYNQNFINKNSKRAISKDELETVQRTLSDNISITYRKLYHIASKTRYNFHEMAMMLNMQHNNNNSSNSDNDDNSSNGNNDGNNNNDDDDNNNWMVLTNYKAHHTKIEPDIALDIGDNIDIHCDNDDQ